MKYLITGDTHGRVMERLSHIDQTLYPPNETAVIILGDAGINFYLNKTDWKNKRIINNTGYLLYCVRGNHEERPENLDMETMYDEDIQGDVYYEPEFPHIRYLKDGNEYCFNGWSALVIGGAYSVDKWYRLYRAGVTGKLDSDYLNPKKTGWFPDEQLTSAEMEAISADVAGTYYDFVFTHTSPLDWEPVDLFLGGIDQSTVDKSMEEWLNNIKDDISFGVWCFGHYHKDRIERPCVEQFFTDIQDLEEVWERWSEYRKTSQLDWWLEKSSNFEEDEEDI